MGKGSLRCPAGAGGGEQGTCSGYKVKSWDTIAVGAGGSCEFDPG